MGWQPTSPRDAVMFRSLADTEEAEFRAYARTHRPEADKWEIYHPVCRDEWTKRGEAPPMKQAFLVVVELEVTDEYIEHIGGLKLTAQAIAGSMGGLLNPGEQPPEHEWKVVDVTAYALAT